MTYNNEAFNLANNATSLLTANIAANSSSLYVTSATGAFFPAAPFVFTLISADKTKTEICLCTAISGDTFTAVTRAYEKVQGAQTALSFSTGDTVELRLTAAVLDAYANNVNYGLLNMIHINGLQQ